MGNRAEHQCTVHVQPLPQSSGTRLYTFHGLRLAVSGPAVLTAAVHARLRCLPAADPGVADITFDFCAVSRADTLSLEIPLGRTRPVYDPPLGEVLYADGQDLLSMAYGERIRVLCHPCQGYTRLAVASLQDGDLWALSHPLFTIPLIEMLKRRGFYSLHAAGLCVNGRGLLFPGTSGSGKSTLTIALLRAGFGFLGDDTLFLKPGQEGVRALAFPDEIDVTDDTAAWFPELHHLVLQSKPPGWPKRPLWAEKVYSAEVVWECRPAVLIFPSVANTDTSVLQPMDRDKALLELAPNILLTEADSAQAHLEILAQLVQESACYRLETGRDVDVLSQRLRDLVT